MLDVLCPLCKANDYKVLFVDRGYDKKNYNVVRCEACGFGYVNPQPTDGELSNIYSQYYGSGDDLSQTADHLRFRRNVFDQICTLIEPYQGIDDRVLDIGCGNGDFLALARSHGWHAHGVEFAGPAVKYAQSRGLDVLEGSFEQLPYATGTFGAVTLLDVLEHLRDPRATLRSARDVLKVGGALVIRVPNTPFQIFKAHLQRARHGNDRTTLATPLHLNHFNAENLRCAVEDAGFEVLSVEPGAADGLGLTLLVKRSYVLATQLLARTMGMQLGNILCLVARKLK